MPATLTARLQSGTAPGTKSAAATALDVQSFSSAENSLANRKANPLAVPADGSLYSHELWLRMQIDTAGNAVSNFRAYSAQGGAEGIGTGLTLNAEGAVVTFATPTSQQRATATPLPTALASAVVFDSGSYTDEGDLTKHLVLQLQVDADAEVDAMPQATLVLAWDEAGVGTRTISVTLDAWLIRTTQALQWGGNRGHLWRERVTGALGPKYTTTEDRFFKRP